MIEFANEFAEAVRDHQFVSFAFTAERAPPMEKVVCGFAMTPQGSLHKLLSGTTLLQYDLCKTMRQDSEFTRGSPLHDADSSGKQG